ncbi:MAG TPA: polysaccharide deacetylase family protein, partial [Ktedonobacteraceae bacterium]|nr:polysaccharide deacetylase family protein [Ktedonobacteraceae bacterium]
QSAPLAQFYPGDNYVDWTAMDGFNWGTGPGDDWTAFKQVLDPTYQDITRIAPHKPIMLAEVASVEQGGDKAAWITEGYSHLLPSYFTHIKAVVWFNQVTQRDWRIESSPNALKAYAQAIKSNYYEANSFQDYQGRLPPGRKYYIAEGFRRPIVTLTFDDGWQSQYTQAFQIMQWYDAIGTFYLVPNFLNTPHYLTTDQARKIQRAGNEIGSHTMNHLDLTEQSTGKVSQELVQSKQVLAAQFGSIKNFAAPFGAFNYQVTHQIQKSYSSDRTTELGFNNQENFNPYEILSQNIYNTTTVAEVNQWLDQATREKTWLVLTFHQVDDSHSPYAMTPQDFEAILMSIRTRDLPLLTLEQGLEEVEPQILP